MRWFDALRRLVSRRPPPARPVVRFDEEVVTCSRPDGTSERIRWRELRAVLIRTTSEGPAVDDLFWVLVGQEAETGCVVPSEAVGCGPLLERLQRLPGFDNQAVILASGCTDDRTFLCWEFDGSTGPGAVVR